LIVQQHADDESTLPQWQRILLPVSGFLLAKLVAYLVVGAVLGLLGQTIALSASLQATLQGVAALIMILTGIRIFRPHWMPWLMIHPPAAVRRYIRMSAKSELVVAPMILGTLTIFIPCGTTVAIEAAALATGSPLHGAFLLGAFIIGTMPMFFLVGMLAKGSTLLQHRLSYLTAIIIIGTGLYSLNAALNLIDAPFSTRKIFNRLSESQRPVDTTLTTQPVIEVLYNGYRPRLITVPVGKPISLQLKASEELSCTNIFLVPKLGIQRQLTAGSTTNLLVTFPTAGDYTFTCGMGMFTGTIRAI
jgi:sulfite exporter TauE/SafE